MQVMLAREGEGRRARLMGVTPATSCPGIGERVWDAEKAVAWGEGGGGEIGCGKG